MVKFLIQHASALEEKEDDMEIDDGPSRMGTVAESIHLERSRVTQSIMRDIQSGDLWGSGSDKTQDT